MLEELIPLWKFTDFNEALQALALDEPRNPSHRYRLYESTVFSALSTLTNTQVSLFLPQLVQAFHRLTIYEAYFPDPEPEMSSCTGWMANYLIGRALEDVQVGNDLYWYLRVSSKAKQELREGIDNVFARLLGSFLGRLSQVKLPLARCIAFDGQSEEGKNRSMEYLREEELFGQISKLGNQVKASKTTRPQKVSLLLSYLFLDFIRLG